MQISMKNLCKGNDDICRADAHHAYLVPRRRVTSTT